MYISRPDQMPTEDPAITIPSPIERDSEPSPHGSQQQHQHQHQQHNHNHHDNHHHNANSQAPHGQATHVLTLNHRLALVATAVCASFLLAGTIFGFQALVPALIQAGVYKELCDDGDSVPCTSQILQLNFVFTVATTLANASSIVIGFVLDSSGPRRTAIVGCGLYALGSLLFGISSRSFPMYTLAYSLMGVGGPFVFISSIHLSLTFPAASGLIMAFLTGAFDSSAIVYNFFNLILGVRPLPTQDGGPSTLGNSTETIGKTGLVADVHTLFVLYTLVPLTFAFLFWKVMPERSLTHDSIVAKSTGENNGQVDSQHQTSPGRSTGVGSSPLRQEITRSEHSDVEDADEEVVPGIPNSEIVRRQSEIVFVDSGAGRGGDLHEVNVGAIQEERNNDEEDEQNVASETDRLLSGDVESRAAVSRSKIVAVQRENILTRTQLIVRQLRSPEYLFITFTVSLYMVKLNFYISTLKEQLVSLSSPEHLELVPGLLNYFNWALPLGGIVGMPFIGILLDNCPHFVSFIILGVMGSIFSIAGVQKFLPLQFFTISIFAVLRPLLYTLGNDYSSKTFGFHTFGRVYGLINLISALFNSTQYALAWYSLKIAKGSFMESNYFLFALTLLALAFPVYLYMRDTPRRAMFIKGEL